MSSFYEKTKPYFPLIVTSLLMILLMVCIPLFGDVFMVLLSVAPYIFWHAVFEFLSIIIAFCIFCVAYYSFEQTLNFRYLVLGSILMLAGFIDFFHTMSYKGMPDFLISDITPNSATTYWIIARLIGAFGLLVCSVIPLKLEFRFNKMIFFFMPVAISLVVLIIVSYYPELIPPMYVEGTGLTDAKILLEYVVIFMILLAIFFLLREFGKSQERFPIIISCALVLGIFSEMAFTLYVDVYDIYNYLGHILKCTMYYVIFRATFIKNIRQPYLELKAARDEIKNYADNLDQIVEQRTEQINVIHKKLLDDLEYARGIQMAMLPKQLPNSAKAAFEACYYPAERVGGDFYNVFPIDESRIGMYIGDVSGHGVSAAMLTVFLNQSIRTEREDPQGVNEPLTPAEVLEKLYTAFNHTDFTNEVYIVMLYGVYNFEAMELTFASAGLNVAPMIVSPAGEVAELVIKGFPICKLPDRHSMEYYNSSIRLQKGEKILFYTDGLIEAQNVEKKAYSDERLKAHLQKSRHMSASDLAKSLSESVFKFTGGCKLLDDITFLVMEVK